MSNRGQLRVLWLGRGGQGAVTASNILVAAFVLEGMRGLSMPEFGVERRGAPVKAYSVVTFEKDRELPREPIKTADVVVIMERSLLEGAVSLPSLSEDAKLLINAPPTSSLPNLEALSGHDVWGVNATQISLEIFKRPLVNMVLLGAFSRVYGAPRLESLIKVAREELGDTYLEANSKAIRRGFEEVRKLALPPRKEEALLHEIA